MRQGPFELLILRSDGSAIAEHELDGKHYIAAEPNTEYKVKVVVHSNANKKLPYEFQKVEVYIDGRAVNYTYTLSSAHTQATFQGFRDGLYAHRAFLFATPPDTDAPVNTAAARSLGSIKLTVNETTLTNIPNAGNFPPVPEVSASGEGKKFWQQPSLQTAHGRVLKTDAPTAPFQYHNVRKTSDATLEIFYHTTDMVNFLKGMQAPKPESVLAAPVHVDLSRVADAPAPAPTPAVTVDLTEATTRKMKLESQSGASSGAVKRARGKMIEIVDLT